MMLAPNCCIQYYSSSSCTTAVEMRSAGSLNQAGHRSNMRAVAALLTEARFWEPDTDRGRVAFASNIGPLCELDAVV